MACTPLQLGVGGGVKNFRKVFTGGEGQTFLYWWGGYIVGRGVNFVGGEESPNFEVKIKIA